MPSPTNLFGLLSEFIVLLLGGLLVAISLSGRFGIAHQPTALLLLGIALLYWGARAGMKRDLRGNRPLAYIRSVSLVLVGLIVAAIPLSGFRYGVKLLGLAGIVLVVRGIAGALTLVGRTKDS